MEDWQMTVQSVWGTVSNITKQQFSPNFTPLLSPLAILKHRGCRTTDSQISEVQTAEIIK